MVRVVSSTNCITSHKTHGFDLVNSYRCYCRHSGLFLLLADVITMSVSTKNNHYSRETLMLRNLVVVVIFSLSTSAANAWTLFGPKDYDECILEGMKGVTSDMAAESIGRSCRKKFPAKSTECEATNLTRAEHENLSIIVDSYREIVFVNIHNNNRSKSVTEMIVKISAENIDPPQEYIAELYGGGIKPLTSGRGRVDLQRVPKDDDFSFSVLSLKGCDE